MNPAWNVGWAGESDQRLSVFKPVISLDDFLGDEELEYQRITFRLTESLSTTDRGENGELGGPCVPCVVNSNSCARFAEKGPNFRCLVVHQKPLS